MNAEWEDTEWYNDLTYEVPEDKRAEYAENTRKAYEKGQKDGLEPYLSPLIEQNGHGGDYSTFGVRIFRGLLRGNEQDEFTTSDKIRPIPTPSEIRANARAIAAVPELIAELKRCYEELDFLKKNVLTDDDYWVATCKPDGEGRCSLTIEGYQELMRLVKENQVEIPEYSHGHDELLLYACNCGITHEEWLESKN